MRKIHALLLGLLIIAAPMKAQKTNRTSKTKVALAQKGKAPVSSGGKQLFASLLPATAKVMFIDSVVVGKNDFISHIPLNAESGKLSVKSHIAKKGLPLTQYETELDDRRFFAVGDSISTALYMQTKVGNAWNQQTCLADISDQEYLWQNYPFLCADGVTLFFSAMGHNAIGGRDIFMTSYDSDKDEWLQPQNYGLPFNSMANDYLLAIDDLDTLGWLVTDRHQHADSVCIYTFVPTPVRENLSTGNLSTAQLERFAQIHRIADTWTFGDRDAAIRRRNAMIARGRGIKRRSTLSFVLNDNKIISDENQLRSEKAKNLFKQWVELCNMIESTQNKLEQERESYARGQRSLKDKIANQEKDLKQQQIDLHNVAKQLRQAELKNTNP